MPEKKKTKIHTTASKFSPETKNTKANHPLKVPRARTKKTLSATPSKTTAVHAKAVSKPIEREKNYSALKSEGTAWRKVPRKGETQMVAFIRDPHCIFTYWEVTPERIEAVKHELHEEYKDSSMVLRLFKTLSNGQAELVQEIRVDPDEMNRYVEIMESTGSYFIEIAQKTASGRTVVYARSNPVMTGGSLPSGAAGPQWETPTGLQEYFTEVEGQEAPIPVRGLSSAEAHRKAIQKALQKKHLGRYAASRMG